MELEWAFENRAMDSLRLWFGRSRAVLRFAIFSVNKSDATSLRILLERGCLNWEGGLHQAHNLSRCKSEVIRSILLSKIAPLDVDGLGEGNRVGLEENN